MARTPVSLMSKARRAKVMILLNARKAKKTKTFYHGSFKSKKIDLSKLNIDKFKFGKLDIAGDTAIIRNTFSVGTLKAAQDRIRDITLGYFNKIYKKSIDKILKIDNPSIKQLDKLKSKKEKLIKSNTLFRVKVRTSNLIGHKSRAIEKRKILGNKKWGISDEAANYPWYQKSVKAQGKSGILYRNRIEDPGSISGVIWNKEAIKKIIKVKTKRQKKGKYSK